jgi:hypothetical protein
MTTIVIISGLILGSFLLSLGIYQWFIDRNKKRVDSWLVGDKIKMFGHFRTFDLLGWSKDYFYIDKDGETVKYRLDDIQVNQSAEWRKSYNDCKTFMGKEPGFDSTTGERKSSVKVVNGRTINSLNETECLIYLKQCLDDEDFETAELIKQRMDELK